MPWRLLTAGIPGSAASFLFAQDYAKCNTNVCTTLPAPSSNPTLLMHQVQYRPANAKVPDEKMMLTFRGGRSENWRGCVRHGTYRGVPAVYTTGITGTGHFGKFGTAPTPVPETSVSSVRQNTVTGNFVKFGTTSMPIPAVLVQTFVPVPDTSVGSVRGSIPVPDASARSVRYQHRYRTLPSVRHDIHTGTEHFGKFGTTSTPVPDTSVSSVRHQNRYRRYRYAHMLGVGPCGRLVGYPRLVWRTKVVVRGAGRLGKKKISKSFTVITTRASRTSSFFRCT